MLGALLGRGTAFWAGCCGLGDVVCVREDGAKCEDLDWAGCDDAGAACTVPFLPRGVFSHQSKDVGFCCIKLEKSASMRSGLAVAAMEAVCVVQSAMISLAEAIAVGSSAKDKLPSANTARC